MLDLYYERRNCFALGSHSMAVWKMYSKMTNSPEVSRGNLWIFHLLGNDGSE